MSTTPAPIAPEDIRVGDTVQLHSRREDYKLIYEFEVDQITADPGLPSHPIKFDPPNHDDSFYATGDTSWFLVHRPTPQLPTEPGSVITAYEVRGVRNEDGWRMMCDDQGEWFAPRRIKARWWFSSGDITDWSPATVTTQARP